MEPKEFFEVELPKRYHDNVQELEAKVRKLRARLDGVLAADAVVRVVLSGPGGGDWTLHVADGKLASAPTDQSQARLMTLVQSAGDFKAAQDGAVAFGFGAVGDKDGGVAGGSAKGAGGPAAGLVRFLTAQRIERLRTFTGTLRFVVTNVDGQVGRNWSLVLVMGSGEPPDPPDKADCTITTAHADSKLMAEGKLAPPAAFMAGKVKILGNMGLAMQLGSLMMG